MLWAARPIDVGPLGPPAETHAPSLDSLPGPPAQPRFFLKRQALLGCDGSPNKRSFIREPHATYSSNQRSGAFRAHGILPSAVVESAHWSGAASVSCFWAEEVTGRRASVVWEEGGVFAVDPKSFYTVEGERRAPGEAR